MSRRPLQPLSLRPVSTGWSSCRAKLLPLSRLLAEHIMNGEDTAMDNSTYDADILAWSEQQAAVLRDLARSRHDLPNELDLENVAEEIECVGRSEFDAV